MKIYNTLTRKEEEFVPIKKNEINMYVCGPTVYDLIHIGNARPIIIFDCFRRYLEYLGYKVNYVQNFTDVDDKIINRANKEGKDSKEISEKYIKEYYKDVENLNVKKPTFAPKVTEHIDVIIKLIEKILENKHGYVVDGNVYFSAASFKDYGKLSNMPIEELESGEDVNSKDLKKSKLDFALWKAAKENEPFWESPWGRGRPGWHIECSAMSQHYLGETLDIHCGGIDLIFPHHENEIAQSESATNKKFANYWMHNGHVKIDGKKMSKSLGNFFTVREICEKYGYEPLRFLIVSSYYKTPINFTKDSLNQSKACLQRMCNFKKNIDFLIEKAKEGDEKESLKKEIKKFEEDFFSALNKDFNTADAVSNLFMFIRFVNGVLKQEEDVSKAFLVDVKEKFLKFIEILGIVTDKSCYTIPEEVLIINEKRQKARKEKNFELADKLREEINSLGYIVEETRNGTKIYKKEK